MSSKGRQPSKELRTTVLDPDDTVAVASPFLRDPPLFHLLCFRITELPSNKSAAAIV